MKATVSPEIVEYVEHDILPRYDGFDKAHRRDHAEMVISQSLELAGRMPQLDADMVYIIAAFHDLGLINGRENHHIDSGKILMADTFVQQHFSDAQIDTMRCAIEDHRASKSGMPRTDYGCVVAEADRFIDPETIIRRTIQYGLGHYPELSREGHYSRTMEHLQEKYGPGGYLKICIPWSDNARKLKELHGIIANSDALRAIFDRIFDEETSR